MIGTSCFTVMIACGGCRKKHKSFEPQRHEGTKEDFICLSGVAQTSPEKLCVFVSLWFPSFQRLLRQPLVMAVAKSIKALKQKKPFLFARKEKKEEKKDTQFFPKK